MVLTRRSIEREKTCSDSSSPDEDFEEQRPKPSKKPTDYGMDWCTIALIVVGVILFIAFFLTMSGFLQHRWLIKTAAKKWPEVLWKFDPPIDKVVALTIDDAISHWTPDYLDLLEANNATATFMVMGNTVTGAYRKEVQRRIWNSGCETGNHMMRDFPSIKLPIEEFERELRETDKRLWPSDAPPRLRRKWFRPGSGWFNDEMLQVIKRNGYQCVLGDLYPWDAQIKKEGFVKWFVKHRLHSGAIIVVHDREHSFKAMAELIPEATSQGWRFVSLSRYCELQEQRGMTVSVDETSPLLAAASKGADSTEYLTTSETGYDAYAA